MYLYIHVRHIHSHICKICMYIYIHTRASTSKLTDAVAFSYVCRYVRTSVCVCIYMYERTDLHTAELGIDCRAMRCMGLIAVSRRFVSIQMDPAGLEVSVSGCFSKVHRPRVGASFGVQG